MTVKELIEELGQHDLDSEVILYDYEGTLHLIDYVDYNLEDKFCLIRGYINL